MARPIVLSNGELHVGINSFGMVHDFYFPYVGLENHAAGGGDSLRHHVGVWCDGEISWIHDDGWTFAFTYPHRALIGHIVAKNERLGIMLEFDDAVDCQISAFMRNIHVVNLRPEAREIRLFMHQAFRIGDSGSNTDTAQYLPDSDAVLHYRGRRAFVVSGLQDNDQPFDQYTVGLFGIEGREGTWRDADDGELSMCAVEHGRVDSTLRFCLQLGGHSSTRVSYWVACGTSLREALYVHKQIRDDGVMKRQHATATWWHDWLTPAMRVVDKLAPEHRDTFLRSLMIMKSQMDKRGAVIASTDTAALNYSRDAYAYSWPRDGAHVMWPLIRLGYVDEPRRFFEFCRRGLHAGGYLMHKYRADGALGSSWHPYIHADGSIAPPIQEDETALVLFVFSQFYQMHADARLLQEFYDSMVRPMATYLSDSIDEHTGLPLPSYDLWEEQYMTTTYTTAVTYAALLAAADLADVAEDPDSAVAWRARADDIHTAAGKHLVNHERGSFMKGVTFDDGRPVPDQTFDMSSLYGAFMFGLFPVGSDELDSAVRTATEVFGRNGTLTKLPRYEDDNYYRADPESLGNPWLICSLWMAQYYIETDRTGDAKRIIAWVESIAGTSSIMPEQVDPRDDSYRSVAPLTWSHAEYVATLLDTITERD